MPGHRFVPLTGSEMDCYQLAREGVPSLLGNGLIFTDERVWKPTPPLLPGLKIYDAIYSARLASSKRHELAAEVESLLLVYADSIQWPNDVAYEKIKAILPRAYFFNHEAGGDRYAFLDAKTMAMIMAHGRVGLCLSAVEGSMRAAMEYLLSGLPIVSTRSIGGRDRYFLGGYCRIVDDDPSAVAQAVRELVGRKLDRRRIRAHVAELLAFDRYNFLLNARKITKAILDRDDLLPEIEPLIGSIERFRELAEIVIMAESQFRHADAAGDRAPS